MQFILTRAHHKHKMGLKTLRAPSRVIYQYWAAFVGKLSPNCWKKKIFFYKPTSQYWPDLCFSANVPTLIFGICIAWNGAFLGKFVSADASPLSTGPLTESQMSWLPGMLMFGSLVGTLPCFWILDIFGRQKTLLWIAFPQILGWILPPFAEYYSTVVSRFLLGLVSGFNFVVTPTFVSEIADDK